LGRNEDYFWKMRR